MTYTYMTFWGVPCCERLLVPRINGLLRSSQHLIEAQTPIQADLLIVFGHITQKQAPYLQNLWADFVFPSSSIHFAGCKKALQNYSLVEDLEQVLEIDRVVPECAIDDKTLSKALVDLQAHLTKKSK